MNDFDNFSNTSLINNSISSRNRTKPRSIFFCLIIVLGFISIPNVFADSYNWGWYILSPFTPRGKENLSFLLSGILPTIKLSLLAFLLSSFLGLCIAILGKMKNVFARQFSHVWVTCFRSVPVLVLLLWTYYGLPIMTNVALSIFFSAMLSMSLCESAFTSEIFRTGINSVSKSQIESARVFGASTLQVYMKIILPQVFVRMLPALINQWVYMVKISSLASVIGFQELTRKSNELTTTLYRPLEIYTILIIEYLVLIFLISSLERWISKKLGPSHDD